MTPRYHINIFWSDDDRSWIADVPDLPGCSAHGASPEAALAEVEQAMLLWMDTARDEGMSIPEPSYQPDPA